MFEIINNFADHWGWIIVGLAIVVSAYMTMDKLVELSYWLNTEADAEFVTEDEDDQD